MHVEYNYKYDCIVDPYTYSGTAILRNKFNIRDSSVLSKVERRITEAKLVLLQTRQLPRGHYDLKHLQAMHKYLFGDIYPKSRSKRSRYSSENDVLIEKSVKYTDFFLLSIVYV